MLSMLGTRKRNHFKFTLLQQHLEFTELISIKSNELSNRNANSHLTPNLSVCLCKVIGLFDPGKDTIHYNNLLSLLNDTQWKLQPPSIILSLSFSVHLIFLWLIWFSCLALICVIMSFWRDSHLPCSQDTLSNTDSPSGRIFETNKGRQV